MRADVVKEECPRLMWAAYSEEEPLQCFVHAISLQRGIPALEGDEGQDRVGDPLFGFFISLHEKFKDKWENYYAAAINKFSLGRNRGIGAPECDLVMLLAWQVRGGIAQLHNVTRGQN